MSGSKYPESFLKQITQMGMLGYKPEKIINVMDIQDNQQFIKEFYTIGTDIQKAYAAGQDKADFIIDIKLFELAKQGDIKALEKFEQRRNPINTLTQRQQEFKGKLNVDFKPKKTIVKANVSKLVEAYAMTPNSGIELKPTQSKPRPPRKTVKTPVKPKEDGDSKTTVAAKSNPRKKVNSGQKVQD